MTAYVLLTVYPVLLTIHSSFFEIRPREPSAFVGWRNYAALAADRTFWVAVKHTAVWSVVAPVLELIIGLLLALGLYARVPLGRVFRVAWFSPVLISYVVVAIMWSWLYNYDWGFVNLALRAAGLGHLGRSWLGEPDVALAALIVVDVWKWTPFHMVVCLAALQGLPREVLEASELDNCGWLRKLRHIVVPMIAPTLLGLLVLGFIGKMKVFDLVWLMTQGGAPCGPRRRSRPTSTSARSTGTPSTSATPPPSPRSGSPPSCSASCCSPPCSASAIRWNTSGTADDRRISASSLGTGPQRTGVRLGPAPRCVLDLLGPRPRPETLPDET